MRAPAFFSGPGRDPHMSKRLLLVATLALAGAAAAEQTPEMNPLPHHFPTKERFEKEHFAKPGGGASTSNLVNHGGPVIHSARVVSIFWGPSWGTGGSAAAIATHRPSFFGQFGPPAGYKPIPPYPDPPGPLPTPPP